MSEERVNGIIRWFNEDKGYGFIIVEGWEKDCFVHRQQMLRSGVEVLNEGDKVSFESNEGKKGRFATAIKREEE